MTDVVDEKVSETDGHERRASRSRCRLPIDRGRRLRGRARGARPPRAGAGRERRPLRRRRRAGDAGRSRRRASSRSRPTRPSYDPGDDRAPSCSRARSRAPARSPSSRRRRATSTAGSTVDGRRGDLHAADPRRPARPRVPVHFVLMRGRVAGHGAAAGQRHRPRQAGHDGRDRVARGEPGRQPASTVELEHPETARPGQKIDGHDPPQRPDGPAARRRGRRSGSSTRPCSRSARSSASTRCPTSSRPVALAPLGARHPQPRLRPAAVRRRARAATRARRRGPARPHDRAQATSSRCRTTTRRSRSAPTARPRSRVELPDDLTNFKLRAKAASGPERFGFATGQICRAAAGDRAAGAAALRAARRPLHRGRHRPRRRRRGRPGRRRDARSRVSTLDGPARRDLTWVENRPERIEFPRRGPDAAAHARTASSQRRGGHLPRRRRAHGRRRRATPSR